MRWKARIPRAVTAAVVATIASFASIAPASADPFAPIWTGAYAGFHGGAKWSDVDISNLASFDTTSATGGGHAGFNLGVGMAVIGLEADANFDGADFGFGTGYGSAANFSTDWSGSIRARAGLPVGPALLYATAGYAWSDATITETSVSGVSSRSSRSFDGVVYGIGAETYVLPNMSIRLEALRYDYGSENISFKGAAAAASATEIDPSETVVRAGLTFHLN